MKSEEDAASKAHEQFLSEFPRLRGSKITFYKNGECQGVAFENLGLPFPAQELVSDSSTSQTSTQTGGFESSTAPRRASGIPGVDDTDDQVTSKAKKKASTSASSRKQFDDGTCGYYPAVSVYRGGSVTMNFGPVFRYPPPEGVQAGPYCKVPTAYSTPASVVSSPAAAPVTHNGTNPVDATSTVSLTTSSTTPVPFRPVVERYVERQVQECVWDVLDEVELKLQYMKAENEKRKRKLDQDSKDKQTVSLDAGTSDNTTTDGSKKVKVLQS
jgi:hypothetical protein